MHPFQLSAKCCQLADQEDNCFVECLQYFFKNDNKYSRIARTTLTAEKMIIRIKRYHIKIRRYQLFVISEYFAFTVGVKGVMTTQENNTKNIDHTQKITKNDTDRTESIKGLQTFLLSYDNITLQQHLTDSI